MNAAFSASPTVDLGDPAATLTLTNNLTGVNLVVSQGVLNASSTLDQLTLSGTRTVNVTGNVDVNTMTWSGGNIGGAGTLRNQGTITYTASGTTTSGAALSNLGTLNVTNGTLVLNQGATHGSDFDVSGGATLRLAGGAHNLTGASNFTGAGTVDVAASGTLNVTGNTTMSADLTCSSAITGNGMLTFAGSTTNTLGGTYNLSGATVVGASTVNFTNPSVFNTLNVGAGAAVTFAAGGNTLNSLNISGGSVTNNGSFATTGSSNLSGGTVQGTGSWDNSGAADMSGTTALTLTGDVNNLVGGTFVKTGGDTSTVTNALFTNVGNLNVDAGTLSFAGGYLQTGGTTRMNGGAITAGAGMQIDGGSVRGNGTITGDVVLNGGSFVPGASPGTTNITGNLTQNGGTLGIELGGLTQGVTFDLLDVTGNVTINSGTLGVSLFGGFTGNPGNLFEVINFGGTFSGAFSTIAEPVSHTLGTTLLANSFELSFLSIFFPDPGEGSLELLNEVVLLLNLQDKFVDDAAIDSILEQLAGAVPTVKCQ